MCTSVLEGKGLSPGLTSIQYYRIKFNKVIVLLAVWHVASPTYHNKIFQSIGIVSQLILEAFPERVTHLVVDRYEFLHEWDLVSVT